MLRTLLRTKLYRPRVGHQIVQRAALRQRIEGGIGGDLTLVTAPAGYGKTTAVADWAAHTGSRVAWVTLDEYDNDIISFLSYTVAAVRSLYTGAFADLDGVLARPHLPAAALALAFALPQVQAQTALSIPAIQGSGSA